MFIQNERSQQANKQKAIEILKSKIQLSQSEKEHKEHNKVRKNQIGSGERSDKIRTVQEQNDKVIDHRTNKKVNIQTYLKGDIWSLY